MTIVGLMVDSVHLELRQDDNKPTGQEVTLQAI